MYSRDAQIYGHIGNSSIQELESIGISYNSWKRDNTVQL